MASRRMVHLNDFNLNILPIGHTAYQLLESSKTTA